MVGKSLDVENLTVRYGGVVAVREISFSVQPGECVVLLGANGAGKTSTLHGIGGLTPATGTIRLGGIPIDSVPADERARAGLGHVLEGRHVFPGLTVRENLRVAAAAARGREAVDVRDLLPEIDQFMDRKAGSLSGGQQQMLAIARALARSWSTAPPRSSSGCGTWASRCWWWSSVSRSPSGSAGRCSSSVTARSSTGSGAPTRSCPTCSTLPTCRRPSA